MNNLTTVAKEDILAARSKKEIVNLGQIEAKRLLDEGVSNNINDLAILIKIKDFSESAIKALRDNVRVDSEQTEGGIKFSLSNTGDRLDYEQDETYAELKQKMKDREAILKLATKSKDVIYDNEGVQVSPVGVKTFGKEIIKANY